MRFVRGALCVVSMLAAQQAWADELIGELHLIHGKVLVNTGKGGGYISAGSARTGDRILVGKHSSAIITFEKGCDVQLTEAQIYTVPKESPCAVAAYIPPAQPVPPPPVAPPPPPVPLVDTTTAIIGASVVGAAVLGGAAYFLLISKS